MASNMCHKQCNLGNCSMLQCSMQGGWGFVTGGMLSGMALGFVMCIFIAPPCSPMVCIYN